MGGNKTSKNVYSGWRKITEMLEANSIMLCPEEQRGEQKVLLKLMDAIQRVELYHSWIDHTTVQNVTKDRYTKCLDVQWPAKYFIFKSRQDQVLSYLQIYNWHKLKQKEVLLRFREQLALFSNQLKGKKEFWVFSLYFNLFDKTSICSFKESQLIVSLLILLELDIQYEIQLRNI